MGTEEKILEVLTRVDQIPRGRRRLARRALREQYGVRWPIVRTTEVLFHISEASRRLADAALRPLKAAVIHRSESLADEARNHWSIRTTILLDALTQKAQNDQHLDTDEN